jgi:hypothetical protein
LFSKFESLLFTPKFWERGRTSTYATTIGDIAVHLNSYSF